MSLSKQERVIYLQDREVAKFDLWKDNSMYGCILVDIDYEILAINNYCRKYFNDKADSLSFYNEASANALKMTNRRILNYERILTNHKEIILKLHQIALEDATPVQFVYFILYQEEYKSLLIHFIPILHENGEIVGMWQYISEYDYWGEANLRDIFMGERGDVMSLKSKKDLPIKLSTRQHELLFMLTHKISLRFAAQLLKISYGNASKIVRESICPKFNIYDADTNALIERAIEMGYHTCIPQSLCNPSIIILNGKIRSKYFNKSLTEG